MTLTKKSFARLSCIALMGPLIACGDATEPVPSASAPITSAPITSAPRASEPATSAPATSEPSTSAPMTETVEPTGLGSTTTPAPGQAPVTSAVPSSAPAELEKSDAPVATGEIPDVVHGTYVVTAQGDAPRECTEDVEAEGQVITIDATTISSFAFYLYVEELQEVTQTSVEGSFTLADDSDTPTTPLLKLGTGDGWQTLELAGLGTESDGPTTYARCS